MARSPKCKKEDTHHAARGDPRGAVREQEEENVEQDTEMDPVLLYEAPDSVQAAMVCELLRQKQICVSVRDREAAGGVLRIYTGSSIYGMDIYVDRSQEDSAKEVLSQWLVSAEDAVSEEELIRQAEAAAPQPIEDNRAYAKVKWAIVVAVIAAIGLLWIIR